MIADPEIAGFVALAIVSVDHPADPARGAARRAWRRCAGNGRTSRRRPRTRGLRGQILRLWRAAATRLFGLDLPIDTVKALAAVSFEVDRGMVGVLGPNGAGKTTLLRQLTGILDSTRGRITLGGVPLLSVRKRLARYVGYLPQDAGLPPRLTARQYLEYYAALYQIDASERAERISTLLREVGLDERADEQIGGYSGGMRQRVAVARTLLRLPPIIVVDEPTVGLDPRERVRFRNLLSRLAKDRIVLFSTHVVEDVAVACERVPGADARPHGLRRPSGGVVAGSGGPGVVVADGGRRRGAGAAGRRGAGRPEAGGRRHQQPAGARRGPSR